MRGEVNTQDKNRDKTITWTESKQGVLTFVRHCIYPSIAHHVQSFMETVFPDGCGLFQQDNAPTHKATMVQEWFEEHNKIF